MTNYTSVADPSDAIQAHIDGWNEQADPFTWTKTADELLDKIESAKAETSDLAVQIRRDCQVDGCSKYGEDSVSGPDPAPSVLSITLRSPSVTGFEMTDPS